MRGFDDFDDYDDSSDDLEDELSNSKGQKKTGNENVAGDRKKAETYFDDDEYYGERDAQARDRMSRDNNRKKKGRMPANAKWAIALVIELIVIAGLAYGIVRTYTHETYSEVGQVSDIKKDDLDINKGANQKMLTGYTTIALFGVDARDASLGKGNRSDAIMILAINNKTKEAKIASVYRDTMMEIQKDSSKTITSKCNTAYAYGGPELAVQTLNNNLDLNISEYVSVNWEGLTRTIDALGGVKVHVEANELNTLNGVMKEQIEVNKLYSDPVVLPAGTTEADMTLNGVQATAYARIRSTGQGDITRTQRQREVLQGMIAKMRKLNASELDSLIDTILPYIGTSITEDQFYDFAKNLTSYKLTGTTGFPLRFADYSTKEKGACLIAQDLSENVSTLQAYLFNTENYTPTEEVQAISSKISAETSIGSAGEIALPAEQSDATTESPE